MGFRGLERGVVVIVFRSLFGFGLRLCGEGMRGVLT